jgi:uncharacterized OB-fold protein
VKRPSPIITDDAREYWEACNDHKLLLQRCGECTSVQFPHRVVCTTCGSRDVSSFEATGKGTLYTYTVVHRAPAPDFQPYVPYIVAHVDLDEGPRIMTNLMCPVDEAMIEMRVEVEFDDDNEQSMPVFRPAA